MLLRCRERCTALRGVCGKKPMGCFRTGAGLYGLFCHIKLDQRPRVGEVENSRTTRWRSCRGLRAVGSSRHCSVRWEISIESDRLVSSGRIDRRPTSIASRSGLGVVLRSMTVISQQRTHATKQPSQASPEAYILPPPSALSLAKRPSQQHQPADEKRPARPTRLKQENAAPVTPHPLSPSHPIPSTHNPGPMIASGSLAPVPSARALEHCNVQYSTVLRQKCRERERRARVLCWPAL